MMKNKKNMVNLTTTISYLEIYHILHPLYFPKYFQKDLFESFDISEISLSFALLIFFIFDNF